MSQGTTPLYAGFVAPSALPDGFLPTAVVQGDFNEDGRIDLAISNGGDNTVYVLLGNGDGTFQVPEVLYTVGQAPVWIAAGKFKKNAHLDLVVVDGDSNQAEEFRGNGDGTFQTPVIVAKFQQTPTYLATSDFNNDGNMDLAVGLVVNPLSVEPLFEVLLGDGTGSFTSSLQGPTFNNAANLDPVPASGIAEADLNNDGYQDVVVTVDSLAFAISNLNQVGDGFTQTSIFSPVAPIISLALGDMDSDGCIDAVQADLYGLVTIAKGSCDGKFSEGGENTPAAAAAGDTYAAISVVDVDGDGHLDVVGAGYYFDDGFGGTGTLGGYLIGVLKGDGKGDLATASLYRAGPNNVSLVVTDLNGDGEPEIVTVSQTGGGATVLSNDGDGGFGLASGETIGYKVGVTNAPNPIQTPQVVDLNGDGKPDILLQESGLYGNLTPQLTSLLNDGTGKFSQPIRSPISVGQTSADPIFVAGNFRSGKFADVIYIANDPTESVAAFFPGNGDGSFGAPVTLSNPVNPALIASGDFNGDGNLDFAILNLTQGTMFDTPGDEFDVFLGDGKGSFTQLPPFSFNPSPNSYPEQLIAGDFNHDGKIDLLIGFNRGNSYSGDLDLALGNGDGTFQVPPITIMPDFGPVAVGDLNHDGFLDLVQTIAPKDSITALAAADYGSPENGPGLTVYLSQPDGTFLEKSSYPVPEVALGAFNPAALVGDFNGDGNLDVAISYNPEIGPVTASQLALFMGNGDGTFAPSSVSYALPNYDHPVIGADFRTTGRTDLLDLIGTTASVGIIQAGSPVAANLVIDAPLTVGQPATATVSLAQPSSLPYTVNLHANDPAVQLPAAVTFSAGESQHSFIFTVGADFDKSHILALTADSNGYLATGYSALENPNAAQRGVTADINQPLSSVFNIDAGANVAMLFNLESNNGYAGLFQDLNCTGLPAGATCTPVEASVQLPAGGWASMALGVQTSGSTPPGDYAVTVSATDGSISPTATFTLNIGGFFLSLSPTTIVINGPTQPAAAVTAAFSTGYTNAVKVSCSGLPAQAACLGLGNPLSPGTSDSLTFNLAPTTLAPGDYPFQLVGAAGVLSQTANAVLRVESLTATLEASSATVTAGKSATFNVTLTSVNHFSSSNVQVGCQIAPTQSGTLSCTAAPAMATLSDGGTATVVLTVTTSSTANMSHLDRSMGHLWTKLGLFSFAMLLPFGLKRVRSSTLLITVYALILIGGINACGGSGSSSVPNPNPPSGSGAGGLTSTPYNVPVVADVVVNSSSDLQVSAGSVSLMVD